jgi:hypothetical protein
MHEPNELIVIDLPPEARMRISGQIFRRMEEMGFTPFCYDALDLGFHLPLEWPEDPAIKITMAQLTVLAKKLNMRFTIGNGNFSPMPTAAAAAVNSE